MRLFSSEQLSFVALLSLFLICPISCFLPSGQLARPSLRTDFVQAGATCAPTSAVKFTGAGVSPRSRGMSWIVMAKVDDETRLQGRIGSVQVDDGNRLLGSRRIAAVATVIKTGVDEDSASGKLLGSRRLAKATKLMLKTAKDPKRLLGSQRLKEARQILFDKAALTNKEEVEVEKKLMGSTRLNLVRKVLVKGASEMKNSAAVAKSTLTKEAAKAAATAAAPAAVARIVGAAPVAMAVVKGMTQGGDVSFCGQKASAQQVKDIATIRRYIADLSEETKEGFSVWIDNLGDVDVLRYLLAFGSAENAWGKLQATARWRKSEQIDGILSEDMSNVFEPGKEEMVYLPADKNGRPILLYRSALHIPGKIDPVMYTRYVTQQTERAVAQYGLGSTAESCVLVDRIGSGLKNQDPALLRVLIPVILNHYPYQVGRVYVAPTSGAFNVIWSVLKLLLDEDARNRFVLIDKNGLAETLKETIPDEVLPTNLGGDLDVTQWLIQRKDLDKASTQLSELELLMAGEATTADTGSSIAGATIPKFLSWAGVAATEEELLIIAAIRVEVAELTALQREQLGPWIVQLENEDILRFLRRDVTEQKTWASLQATSKWRKDEKIDDLVNEDLSELMPEGGEEFYYTGTDQQNRPVLIYRSCAHTPGRIDPNMYNRYVIKTLEEGRKKYGLGSRVQAAVVVDRVGSGMKNQDPALLRVLIPCFTTHFPGVVGNIYIAPVNAVFYAVWSLVSLLLDPVTRESVKLLKKETKTEELLQVMDASSLPTNLGGDCRVPQAGIL